jgi:APA family basic amino acid/polyamine antiporter
VRLHGRAGYSPPYRAWGYPLVPLAFIGAAILVAVIQIAADPLQAATGLALVVLGLPVYYLWVRRPHAHH